MPSDHPPTSATLLDRLRADDQVAWHRLVHLYAPLVHFWCGQWGIHGADADDVRQEVFQAVAVGLTGFRRDRPGDTFRGWLRGVTRNKLLDHRRRGTRQPSAPGGTDAQNHLGMVADPNATPADEPAEQVTQLYHRALSLVRDEFEEKTWHAFWRAAVDGHPVEVIATEMGVTPAAVRKAKSRVLRRLKEEIGDLVS